MTGERHGRGMGAACYVWIGLNFVENFIPKNVRNLEIFEWRIYLWDGPVVLMFKQTPKIIPHIATTILIFPNKIKETLLSQHSATDWYTEGKQPHLRTYIFLCKHIYTRACIGDRTFPVPSSTSGGECELRMIHSGDSHGVGIVAEVSGLRPHWNRNRPAVSPISDIRLRVTMHKQGYY